MKLVNIYNYKRKVYLFQRDEAGNLFHTIDDTFFPYYYEPATEGRFKSFDGQFLKKCFVNEPKEVKAYRSQFAYEADIIFTKRYMLDKVEEMTKANLKYAFIDVEILTKALPDVKKAECPVSCISIYNSQSKEIITFYLADYENEYTMLEDFVNYMKREKFDLWLSWNVQFDYNYLHNRIPDFPKKISPIGKARYVSEDIMYPAGISIVDYLTWFKKVTLNKIPSYTLDNVGEHVLGKGKVYKKMDFSVLSPELKARNIEDVQLMVDLEAKKKVIPYFDELRRISKVEWEDLHWNSRIIDSLILQEAKKQNIILPMKPNDNEKEEFEGAYREAYDLGAHWNIGKYDLASAYPNMIIDFCLDPSNIIEGVEQEKFTSLEIEETTFAQNPNALLPTVCRKLLDLKKIIGNQKKSISVDDPTYEDIKQRYDAIKTIVNSAYGVMGNRFFRLYDKRVASATTFLVRDVLHYVRDKLEEQGTRVIYVDTDSVFLNTAEDLTSHLNNLILEWAVKYQKEEISTDFECEGIFTEILILAKCRYMATLRKPNGEEEPENKGVELKRKDSTVFMKEFQKTIVRKILDKEDPRNIIDWVKDELLRIETVPLTDVAFPCKISKNPKEYKTKPIFVRAVEETEGFNPLVGEDFFYIYVDPIPYYVEQPTIEYYREVPGKREGTTKKEKLSLKKLKEITDPFWIACHSEEEVLIKANVHKRKYIKKVKKLKDVKAFNENSEPEFEVDWNKMKERNILNKIDVIFNAMGWDMSEINEI